jgi:hypothetical protein
MCLEAPHPEKQEQKQNNKNKQTEKREGQGRYVEINDPFLLELFRIFADISIYLSLQKETHHHCQNLLPSSIASELPTAGV